jgi:hypothetical protein
MRPPVLIIGAHRSGTSATAHALQILGLQIGQRLDSHYEPKPLQKLHEHYLRTAGASWYDPAPFLESLRTTDGERQCVRYLQEQTNREFSRIFGYRKNPPGLWMLTRIKFGAAWGWKEPRTTLFAPAWLKIFPGARLVHLVRDSIAAAQSIRARELKFRASGDPPSGEIEDLKYAAALVRTYTEAAEQFDGGENYFRIQFEDLQREPAQVLDELGRFCALRFSADRLRASAATIRPRNSAPAGR